MNRPRITITDAGHVRIEWADECHDLSPALCRILLSDAIVQQRWKFVLINAMPTPSGATSDGSEQQN